MREILFRGKRQDNGEWVDGHLCKDGFGKMYIIHYVPSKYNNVLPERKVIRVDPETVGQFIGMTDKNGKKIWENDIIQMYYKGGETNIGTIRYTNECVRFQYYEGNLVGYGIDITCDMEVIGNIFDDPELLEGDVSDED